MVLVPFFLGEYFMRKKVDILTGNIGINLFKLSLPVILTSLVSILYNLTDIKFISQYLGDFAVSSAAAATFFIVLSFALLIIPKNGAQLLVAQSIGAKLNKKARAYARVSLIITFIFSIFCLLISVIFAKNLIQLVGISKVEYLNNAVIFLRISALGFPFLFLLATMSAIISADGDTFGPFVFNSIGVILNIFLDYLLLGVFKMGISGAAFATVISQIVSFLCIAIYLKNPKSKFKHMKIFKLDSYTLYFKVIKIGMPAGISQALFTLISIVIANMIASFDESVLGVQRLGVQFESFSWNIAGGVSSAVATYVAQNYGAKQYDRINNVYNVSVKSISVFGALISFVFIFFARDLYSIFFTQEDLINYGVAYLQIIGLTQILQCIEIITTGAFNGIGKINEPTIIGVIGTGLRIPFIYILAPIFGINTIWWVISISMLLKGIVSYTWFKFTWIKFLKERNIYL